MATTDISNNPPARVPSTADFEEVSGTIVEETTSTGETRTVIEEQVTDAEFEEI